MRVKTQLIDGRGTGLVATEHIAAGSTVLEESRPLVRAACAVHLHALQEETAMLVSMGYIADYWAHVLKDRRVCECLRASVDGSGPADAAAFLELQDAFDTPGAEGRFLTNSIQLPAPEVADRGTILGDLAVYRIYSRINHSCEPNVRVQVRSDGRLSVVAARGIEAGEEVMDHYMAEVDALGDVPGLRAETRRRLKDRWRFQCDCARCRREGPVGDVAPAISDFYA